MEYLDSKFFLRRQMRLQFYSETADIQYALGGYEHSGEDISKSLQQKTGQTTYVKIKQDKFKGWYLLNELNGMSKVPTPNSELMDLTFDETEEEKVKSIFEEHIQIVVENIKIIAPILGYNITKEGTEAYLEFKKAIKEDHKYYEILDLSKKNLTLLPDVLTKHIGIKTLNLSDNNLAALPVSLKKMEGLEKIILLGNTLLTEIPEWLSNNDQIVVHWGDTVDSQIIAQKEDYHET